MGAITILTSMIIIAFGVLEIILFFKLWSMCDDVKVILSMLESHLSKATEEKKVLEPVEASFKSKFSVGQLVIITDNEEQFRVSNIVAAPDGSCLYYAEQLDKYFTQEEIEDFADYWKAKKS